MKRIASVLAATAVLIIAIVAVARMQTAPAPSSSGPVPHYQTSSARQLAFSEQPIVSKGSGPVVVQLVSGAIPADVAGVTVLTDENCQPDQDGVSHCLNRIQFTSSQGSGEATVQHHHRMAEESCLTPGETLTLIR